MQQHWYCDECFSMNRANAGRCYKCHSPRSQMATSVATERQAGALVTPALDEEDRKTAASLMAAGYTSAWQIGHLAAGLLAVTLALVCINAALRLPGLILQLTGRPFRPSDVLATGADFALFALGAIALLTVMVHSAFLCLAAKAAPALGCGFPCVDPASASLWWIESEMWAICGAVALVVPLFFVGLFGILARLVLSSGGSFWVLGSPMAYFGRPHRQLVDLWQRLADSGSAGTRPITIWSLAWGTAHAFAAICAVFFGMAMLYLSFRSASEGRAIAWTAQGVVVIGTLAMLVAVVELLAVVASLYLLAQITWELANRQKTREEWVLSAGPTVNRST